jgi:hypothetical protein
VTPVAGLGTTEAGGSASFSVVLKSEPTADVVIAVASSDVTEGTVSAASLTFTAADWNVPQTVTVTGARRRGRRRRHHVQHRDRAVASDDPSTRASIRPTSRW